MNNHDANIGHMMRMISHEDILLSDCKYEAYYGGLARPRITTVFPVNICLNFSGFFVGFDQFNAFEPIYTHQYHWLFWSY